MTISEVLHRKETFWLAPFIPGSMNWLTKLPITNDFLQTPLTLKTLSSSSSHLLLLQQPLVRWLPTACILHLTIQLRPKTWNVGMFAAEDFGMNRNVDMFVANRNVWLCEIKNFNFLNILINGGLNWNI